MKILTQIITGTVLLTLAACGKDSYYTVYDPNDRPIEQPGNVTIQIVGDMSEKANSTIILTDASGYIIRVKPGETSTVEATTYQVSILTPLIKGADMSTLSLKGNTVNLAASTDNELPSVPLFAGGSGTVTITKNGNQTLNITPQSMTHALTYQVTLTGANLSEIEPITATLQGIAASQTLPSSSTHITNRGEAANYFTSTVLTQEDGSKLLQGTIRILGIDTNQRQLLVIKGTRADGMHPILELDITDQLANFNSGSAYETKKLAIQLIYDTKTGLTGSIVPWHPGWESDVTN